MAMFPDSGVPPGDAKNSLPDVDTKGCDELWYSTSRCQPRFDPAAANAMLAETMNLIMKGEVQYDCIPLDNLEHAVRYIVQRGLPHSGFMTGGPFDYVLALDPTATRLSDYLTVMVVPQVTNQGASRLNLDNLGFKPILRNDGKPLKFDDMTAGYPMFLTYYQGEWYVPNLCKSQVPLIGLGSVNGWIRTDGNDTTGDGTANTADKAFRTIEGAYNAIGSRYAQTPGFSINLRLGIPGTYDAAHIASASNAIQLFGDVARPQDYKIKGRLSTASDGITLNFQICDDVTLWGVTLLIDSPSGINHIGLRCVRSTVVVNTCRFEMTTTNPDAGFLQCADGTMLMAGVNHFLGGNGDRKFFLTCSLGGKYASAGNPPIYNTVHVSDANFDNFFEVSDLAVVHWGPYEPVQTAGPVTGPMYRIQTNSILRGGGVTIPGSTAGTVLTGAQFVP
jgi:hypothetical protein